MRIISQDGTIDMPYEQVIIQRFKKDIYFLNKNLIIGVEKRLGDMVVATYSKEEKAKKAMEMLRVAYAGRFITNADVPENFDETIKSLMKGGFGTVIIKDESDRVEFSNLNGYFQFPAEEELE